MPSPATPFRADAAPLLDRTESVLRRVTQPVAFAGVLGMLAVAGVTVVAVGLRWSGVDGITAMNEIVAMLFSGAIAATLPAATAQRVHLRIDLLGPAMGPRLRGWLDVLAATLAALAWAAHWGLTDFRGRSRAVSGSPSVSAGLVFALLWITMLLLMPVAAVMGLMRLVGTALFLNWRAAWSVLSSEPAGFLTNPQVAALPLFLLMGSFAMVAGLSEDVYRLARAVLGRLRGGLALATVGGARGSGPSPDRRWPPSPLSAALPCQKCGRRAIPPHCRRARSRQGERWAR